ncbi:MAG: hypothetical protein AAF847_06050 [Bacteroidota bacterium]
MKYLWILLITSLSLACAAEQSEKTADTTTEEQEMVASETATTTDQTATAEIGDINEKMKVIADLKSQLIALENIPADMEKGIEAGITVMERMEGQIANWESKIAILKADPSTEVDGSKAQEDYEKAIEQGEFLSSQLDQAIKMAKRQLSRVGN